MSEQIKTYFDHMAAANEIRQSLITEKLDNLVARYGSMRAVGEKVKVDHAYLQRLRGGEKTMPSNAILRKIGLRELAL